MDFWEAMVKLRNGEPVRMKHWKEGYTLRYLTENVTVDLITHAKGSIKLYLNNAESTESLNGYRQSVALGEFNTEAPLWEIGPALQYVED